jgi:predicted  nucleic acid-binding Zn-ribbon protein
MTIGLAIPSFAAFYQYTDESGVLRFTDDLTQVPEEQRPKVKKYLEPDDSLTPEQRAQKALDARQEPAAEEKMGVSKEEYLAEFERLDKKKTGLDQRYTELAKERNGLAKEKEAISSETELKDYNEKVSSLNKRITAFEREREVFSKEVDAFNELFKE